MDRKQERLFLGLILIAAVGVRLVAVANTAIVNPDGPIYLHQAQAISHGDLQEATRVTTYLSFYPFLVALCHLIVRDWLVSGVVVSFLAATLILLPLHAVLRRFFSVQQSLAATAVLAFLPLFVSRSADVLRDPLAWFLATLGMACLAKGVTEEQKAPCLLGTTAFLLATWTRIEFLWYLMVAVLALPFFLPRRRALWTWLALPPFLSAMLALSLILLRGHDLTTTGRLDILLRFPSLVANGLQLLSTSLRELTARTPAPVGYFLDEARRSFYLVGIGTLANRILEAATYPFALVALLGIGHVPASGRLQPLRQTGRILFAGAVAILCLHIFWMWVLEYRYTLLATLPCAVLFAAGLVRLAHYCSRSLKIPPGAALFLVALLLIATTLPKTLQPRRDAEAVFQTIGATVAQLTPGKETVTVVTSLNSQTATLVNFYANRHRKRFPPPLATELTYEGFPQQTPQGFLLALQQQGIPYLLWEEHNRPQNWPLDLASVAPFPLQEQGRWRNHQTGLMILYRIPPPP